MLVDLVLALLGFLPLFLGLLGGCLSMLLLLLSKQLFTGLHSSVLGVLGGCLILPYPLTLNIANLPCNDFLLFSSTACVLAFCAYLKTHHRDVHHLQLDDYHHFKSIMINHDITLRQAVQCKAAFVQHLLCEFQTLRV